MKIILRLLILIIAFQQQLFAQQLPDTALVVVIPVDYPTRVPKEAKYMGKIKVGDGMKLNCGYTETVQRAKDKAREKGGNLVKITQLRQPDSWSSCYRLQADVYYYDNVASLRNNKDPLADSIVKALMPDTASYALLFAYRPRGGVGPIIRYDLHVDDSVVGLMKLGSAYVYKLVKTGRTKVWARTESEAKVLLDVEPRKVYFLRTTVQMGIMVGRPRLDLVNTKIGLQEFSINEDRMEEKQKRKEKRGKKNIIPNDGELD